MYIVHTPYIIYAPTEHLPNVLRMNYKYYSYLKGVCWFLLALLSSVCNDIIAKKIGLQSVSSAQISFLRFLWATITLVPFILYSGIQSFESKLIKIHILRSILLFAAISIWTYSLTMIKIMSVTIVSFTIPLITLILARIILKENIKWYRWIATILGMIGVTIALYPTEFTMSIHLCILCVSAFIFALLDVINKKIINQENMLPMLFYSSLFTTIIASPFAYYSWVPLSNQELILTCILGCGANLILYFLLKSFRLVDSSALAPYRYLELILSALGGATFFNESINNYTWIGGAILVISISFVLYTENTKHQLKITKN